MSETRLRTLVERLDSFHEDFDAQYGEAVPLLAAVLCAEASDEISKIKSQLEEARRGLKIALHALKNVDGPFIEHEGAHGIFLAKEHDCTCWDAEQTVTAFLNGSAK